MKYGLLIYALLVLLFYISIWSTIFNTRHHYVDITNVWILLRIKVILNTHLDTGYKYIITVTMLETFILFILIQDLTNGKTFTLVILKSTMV